MHTHAVEARECGGVVGQDLELKELDHRLGLDRTEGGVSGTELLRRALSGIVGGGEKFHWFVGRGDWEANDLGIRNNEKKSKIKFRCIP
jgi:hypothetical protein